MQINRDIHYVGVNDRVKHRFEGLWLLPQGVSYNSYLLVSDKVVLIDTVDVAFFPEYLAKIKAVIGERQIDFLVVNHMEPDHSGAISLIRQHYPNVTIVGNRKTIDMVAGFYGEAPAGSLCVANGESLTIGSHTLRFYLAPMLHWPETMVTFDESLGVLFSGDAFGCFGCLNGAVTDDQIDTTPYWSEMERYYASILGKYAMPVQEALKKLGGLDIKMICSTHGPVWKDHVDKAIETYRRMSAGETEEGIVVCYGSMYGNTQRMVEALAHGAAEGGVRRIIVHNLSVSQPSFVLADIFRYKGLAIGAPTYNGGVFPAVDDLLKRLAGREVSKHKLAYFGGFTWASAAVKAIGEYNEKMRMEVVGEPLQWKQGARNEALSQAYTLGRTLALSVRA